MTVIRVTDGYNASLVSFSLGIAVATFTFIALAIMISHTLIGQLKNVPNIQEGASDPRLVVIDIFPFLGPRKIS